MDLQHDFDLTCSSPTTWPLSAVSHRVMVMYLGQIAEMAPSDQLYARPRHPTPQPYSPRSDPDPDASDRRHQIVLSGDIPSPTAPPPGCRFHTRCPQPGRGARDRPTAAAGARDAPQHHTAYVPWRTGSSSGAECRDGGQR
jgi:oligopeptide/dipeptide ABC transporter ATP-binding protein